MKIQFCPECGKPLEIRRIGNEETTIGVCTCGFSKRLSKEIKAGTKVQKKSKIGKGVFENNFRAEAFPHRCKKCGSNQADVIDLGAPYSDESNVYLFRCKKCGNTIRQTN